MIYQANGRTATKAIAALAAFVVILGSGWYYVTGTPQYSFYLLQKAIADGDKDTIKHYVDADSIAENVFDHVWELLEKKASEKIVSEGMNNGYALMGAGMAMGILNNMKPAIKSNVCSDFKSALESTWLNNDDIGTSNSIFSFRTKLNLKSVHSIGEGYAVQIENVKLKSTRGFILRQNRDRTWKIVALSEETLDLISKTFLQRLSQIGAS